MKTSEAKQPLKGIDEVIQVEEMDRNKISIVQLNELKQIT